MLRYIIPSIFFLFIGISLFGQVPKSIRVIENTSASSSRSQMMCENKSAGTITFLDIDPNDANNPLTVDQIPDPIFLCHGFQFRVDHNGDQNLEGDTNPATTPGVGYAVYANQPTNAVSNLGELIADTDRFINPASPTKPLVFVDDVSGDALFWNENNFGNGISLQDSLNGGAPTLFWFAPITFDDEDNNEAVYEDGDNSCLHVSLDQAFSVVYLNEITIDNISKGTCSGSFTINGGMPEYAAINPSILSDREYTVEIVNSATGTAVTGISGNLEAGGTVNFNVTSAGNYIISVSDGKSCIATSANVAFDMTECPEQPSIVMDCPYDPNDINAIPIAGSVLCLDLTMKQFTNMVSAQFIVTWDTSIMELTQGNITPNNDLPNITTAFGYNDLEDGELRFSWLTDELNDGSTFDDGTSFFNMCFQTKKAGRPNVQIIGYNDPSNFFPLEFNNSVGDQITFDVTGGICPVEINPPLSADELQVRADIIRPCLGETNGQLNLTIAGGTAPYSLELIGQNTGRLPTIMIDGTTAVVENLAADTYDYSILDADGTATATSVFAGPIIIDPSNLAITFLATDPLCIGTENGRLEAVVRENASIVTDLTDFTFAWFDVSENTPIDNEGPILEGIKSGEYAVTITNNNGCPIDDDKTLIDPLVLRINNIRPDEATCSGSFDGELTASASGGTGILSYRWDIDTTINDANITGLDVGDYQLVVTDENGCTVGASQRVSSDSEIVINLSGDSISCFKADDAILIAERETVSGFPTDAVYTFSWLDEDGNTIPTSGTPSGINTQIEDLSPGTYTVRLDASSASMPSANVCFASEEITITEPDSLIINADIEATSNCRNPDGRIELTIDGGTAGYSYDWQFKDSTITPPANNINVAPNLPPDSVTIIVTDANNCEATLDTVITSPLPPVIKEFLDNSLLCADDTEGTLQVIAEPGDADVTSYRWSHNASVTGNFAGNLGPDTFVVAVIDENFCETIDTAIITAPPPITFTNLDTLQEACFGEANGSLEIVFEGGSPGYDYNWVNENDSIVASNNTQITGVAAGTYRIVGEDANGCEFPQMSFVLPSLPEIEINFPMDRIKGTSCFDNGLNPRDGEAFVEVNYADGRVGEFDIFWPSEQVIGVTESEATNLGSGMIEVLVLESVGICSNKATVEIPSPSEVMLNELNTSFRDVTCNGGNDGTITVEAMGGTAPYTYTWDYEGSMASTLRDLPRGTYNLTITDDNDCIAGENFEIIEPAAMELTLDFDNNNTRNVVCFGDENGQITVIPTGGNTAAGGISYSWLPNVANGPIATDLKPGVDYTVTATDSKGCTAETNYTVQQPSPILWNIQPNMDIQCNGGVTTLVANELSFSGGNGGDYMYSVDNSPAQTLDKVIQVRAGDHIISVYDSGGCQQDSTINIPEPEAISIEFPSAELDGRNLVTEVELGGEIALNPDIFSPLPIADLIWTSSNPADSAFLCNDPAFCDNPIVSPLENTTYSLSITDQNGCTAEASLLVEVDKNRNVFIPQIFVPNGRGFDLNENFKIYSGVGVEMIEFARVFDRWGAMVASIDSPTLPSNSGIDVWDGKIKGQRAPQGVYVYIISITFVDGTNLLYRGDVTLMR